MLIELTIMYKELKERAYEANMAINKAGLVVLTWGNVSEYDRNLNAIAIKPSGVSYDEMKPEHMVIIDPEGSIIEGKLTPSSDTATHLVLYKNFSKACGVVHIHSPFATAFAQAKRPIPCFGTTHADVFYGEIPVTDSMTEPEIKNNYERETGKVIVRCFEERKLSPDSIPAVLVASHGPFIWGTSGAKAVENAITLEAVAAMAHHSLQLQPHLTHISNHLLDKHFLRKHGSNAYYGQSTKG